MKTFKVIATYTVICRAYVEAETQEEASNIADNMDGSSFKEIDTDTWEIYSITEEKHE
jgi:predicted RNase H-like nuclease